MEQIIIRVRDRQKAETLLQFLKTLDYIENIARADLPPTNENDASSEAEFFSLAGIWAGRDISQESLRKQAWPSRI